jgi:hypothetical protein
MKAAMVTTRRTFLNALGIAGPVLLLAFAPAWAGETSMPAKMTSCTLLPETIDRRVTPPERIRVSFTITGDVPADLVRFTARAAGGGFVGFSVYGRFTKTVMIADRELQADPTAPVHELPRGVDCVLTYIHFVDGTRWSSVLP